MSITDEDMGDAFTEGVLSALRAMVVLADTLDEQGVSSASTVTRVMREWASEVATRIGPEVKAALGQEIPGQGTAPMKT